MSFPDRYGHDVLAAEAGADPRARVVPVIEGQPGLVVECARSGWCGAVVGWQKAPGGWAVVLEDRHGARRPFTVGPNFLVDGELVEVVRPRNPVPAASAATVRTASGSIAVSGQRARVARASRIWVEGSQDAQLVEKVWGDDLRIEGVVVEHLSGADNLLAQLDDELAGSSGFRIGVLLDHLVAGSKESRIAADAMSRWPERVLVVGHPYVDVWQSVRPASAGISQWPVVDRGTDWKTGVCAALGWGDDTSAAWRRLLACVRTYADLEPSLLGRVEELIDFVTTDS